MNQTQAESAAERLNELGRQATVRESKLMGFRHFIVLQPNMPLPARYLISQNETEAVIRSLERWRA